MHRHEIDTPPAANNRAAWALAQALALTLTLTCGLAGAQTTDAKAGRQKAQACAVCHGLDGIAVAPDAPHLAGQPSLYLVAQLRAYRNGTRKHEVMAVMARPLSDEDITQLAEWFGSIKVQVQPAP